MKLLKSKITFEAVETTSYESKYDSEILNAELLATVTKSSGSLNILGKLYDFSIERTIELDSQNAEEFHSEYFSKLVTIDHSIIKLLVQLR